MSAMNTFLRLGSIAFLGSMSAAVPMYAAGDIGQFYSPLQDSPAYISHQSQGYLGVDMRDVDSSQVGSLKLKDAKGAEILVVDRDAPACKAGIKPKDVILEMNGQPIDGAEQLRRMLRESPAGKNVDFVISRDGVLSTVSVQLADRATIGEQAWNKHQTVPEPLPSLGLVGNTGLIGEGGGGGLGGMFTGHVNALHIGAAVNPVTPQLATYFGVKAGAGLLVASVEKNSPAAAAGLRAGDVVLKVNQDAVVTRADWERVMRENAEKTVQITLVRDKKEQTITMQPSTKKGKDKSDLNWQRIPSQAELDAFTADANQLIAQLDSKDFQEELRQSLEGVDAAAIQREMEQAQKEMQKQLPSKAELDAMIADAQRIQKSFDAEQKEFAKSLQGFDAKAFQKQMDGLKKTMPDAFSPEKMKEFQHQIEQLQKEFQTNTMD
jgi:serine protease Do